MYLTFMFRWCAKVFDLQIYDTKVFKKFLQNIIAVSIGWAANFRFNLSLEVLLRATFDNLSVCKWIKVDKNLS